MKILLYSMNFWPEATSTGKYSGEMAVWLADHGHQVRVIAAPPYYPEWKVADGYSAFRYSRENFRGVEIRRCPAWIPARPNGWKRILCLALFGISCVWESFKSYLWRPDVVIVVEPPICCAPGAWFFARLGRAQTWLHIQDFEVDAALQLGMLRGSVLRKLALSLERFLIRRFDRRSTISERMMDRLNLKIGCADDNVLFPNWVDCDEILPLARSDFRDSLKLDPSQRVALYAGNIGVKQGLEIVVEAARLLQHQTDLVFVICGNGAAIEDIRSLAEGLPNVLWLPVQPTEKLNDLLNLADVHLLPQRAGAADLVMPSKLTGMLASGRAVLATANPGTQVSDLVSQVGKVVPPQDPQRFADALVEMLESPQDIQQWSHRAREIAEVSLSRDAILRAFETQLQECVSSSRHTPVSDHGHSVATPVQDPRKPLR